MVLLPFPSEDQNKLLSSLVALARTTEGNTHLLDKATDKALLEGVLALESGDVAHDIRLADDERARLVPDCFVCKAPCGKNSPYDVQILLTNPDGIRSLKAELLSTLLTLANSGWDGEYRFLFCQALFAIGRDDWEEEYFAAILSDLKKKV